MRSNIGPPPLSPSPDQQRDALRKGLGRAVGWARTGRLDEGPLLAACLEDFRYDAQVDGPRGDWVWGMIEAVGAADRFRGPILDALLRLEDDRSAEQLCGLARRYAEAGDERCHRRLVEIVEGKPIADRPWLGEEELLQLDGEQGFLVAARAIGRRLAESAEEWDDGNLVSLATERFGEANVQRLLRETSDEAIAFFRENWQREVQRKAQRPQNTPYSERMRAIPVAQVVRAAEGKNPCFWLRGWGKAAGEADLRAVLDRLWAADNSHVVANLLQVFAGRALPEFDARLIGLCQHNSEDVRRQAIEALGQNVHPLIREFAGAELANRQRAGSVVGLFVRNYHLGDERIILEAVDLPAEIHEAHALVTDLIAVLNAYPEADRSHLGLIAYTTTPCEICRYKAARLLIEGGVAPRWLRDECRDDAHERTRALAAPNTTVG